MPNNDRTDAERTALLELIAKLRTGHATGIDICNTEVYESDDPVIREIWTDIFNELVNDLYPEGTIETNEVMLLWLDVAEDRLKVY